MSKAQHVLQGQDLHATSSEQPFEVILQSLAGEQTLRLDAEFNTRRTAQDRVAFFEQRKGAEIADLSKFWAVRNVLTNVAFLREVDVVVEQTDKRVKEAVAAGQFDHVEFMPHSMGQAIQDAKKKGFTYEQMLETISRTSIQVVGTEHPTDELSQHASNLFKKLLNLKSGENTADTIGQLMQRSLIPSTKRSPNEEASRNIHSVATSIHEAREPIAEELHRYVKAAYPEQYQAKDIDKLTSRLVMPVSWAGVESDGNTEITPESTKLAFGIGSEEAAKRHKETIDDIRETVNAISQQQTRALGSFSRLDSRKTAYETAQNRLMQQGLGISIAGADASAQQSSRMEQFTKTLKRVSTDLGHYQEAVQERRDYVAIGTKKASEYISEQYQKLTTDYKDIIEQSPALQKQFQKFGQDVENFGMHYTLFEGRHKSDDHQRVWGMIIDNLQDSSPAFQKSSFAPLVQDKLFASIYKNDPRKVLSEEERTHFMTKLLDGSKESKEILDIVKSKYKSGHYQRRQENIDSAMREGPEVSYNERKRMAQQVELLGEVQKELSRHEGFKEFEDRVPVLINSNTERPSDMFLREGLMRLFDIKKTVNAPLFESKKDIEQGMQPILDTYYSVKIKETLEKAFDWEEKNKITDLKALLGINDKKDIAAIMAQGREGFAERVKRTPELRLYLAPVVAQIMLGFSDSERESGIGALISVQKGIEKANSIFEGWGLDSRATREVVQHATNATPGKRMFDATQLEKDVFRSVNQSGSIFLGNGSDANRGGNGFSPEKGTLQGVAKTALFGTPTAARHYLDRCIATTLDKSFDADYQKRIALLPAAKRNILDRFEQASTQGFEKHLDEKQYGKAMSVLMPRLGDYMVPMLLNSSSRATILRQSDNSGDRYMPLKTDGETPAKVANIGKWRAITQGQAFEFMPFNFSMTGGIGNGLAALKKEEAVELFKTSPDFRDIVKKSAQGIARADFALLRQAALPGQPPLSPDAFAAAVERGKKLPETLKTLDMKTLMKQDPAKVSGIVSDYLALHEHEHRQTEQMLKSVLTELYPNSMKEQKGKEDILRPWPELYAQQSRKNNETVGLQSLAAFIIQKENQGIKLDTVVGEHASAVLSNVGSGLNQSRMAPPASYEPILGADVKSLRAAEVVSFREQVATRREAASSKLQSRL